MDNQKNPEEIREESQMDAPLPPLEVTSEIVPDEQAVSAAEPQPPMEPAAEIAAEPHPSMEPETEIAGEMPAVDTSWLLAPEESADEIGPDEQAVSAAGLKDPQDLEFEQLLAEARAISGDDAPQSKPEPPKEEMPALEVPKPAEAPAKPKKKSGKPKKVREPIAEETPMEPLKTKKPARKRRPSHKKGYGFFGIPHVIATVIWLAIAVAIGTSLGNVLWLCAADVLAFEQEPKTVTITITEEDDLDSIANKLYEEELIKYPELFKLFANITGKVDDIVPGSFTLNAPDKDGNPTYIVYDYNALLNAMNSYVPSREIVESLLIPEGYTCAQIFALLEANNVCTVEELEEYAANGDLDEYWFLEGVQRGDRYCLEGYLFPDTYDFYVNDDPERVLEKMLDAFDNRFTDRMHDSLIQINEQYAEMLRAGGYSSSYIEEHPITIREVVIIASMIQKEASGADDSYTISSVIFNRLSSRDFPRLQLEATVVYAHGGSTENLDFYIDSPYNTYVCEGLPIGAISNPGREALNAAMNPEDTNYYYYALNPTTYQHEFFSSYSAFQDFLEEHGFND